MLKVRNNAILFLLLGLCPALAVTTRVASALVMGIALTLVLSAFSVPASFLYRLLPARVRLFIFLAIAASLATLVDLALQAWMPAMRGSMGIYLPLLAVNCLVIGADETFAHGQPAAILEALSTGIGFTLTLLLIAVLRELLGAGTISLVPVGAFEGVLRIPGLAIQPARVMAMAAGAFLVVGYLMGLSRWIRLRRERGPSARRLPEGEQ